MTFLFGAGIRVGIMMDLLGLGPLGLVRHIARRRGGSRCFAVGCGISQRFGPADFVSGAVAACCWAKFLYAPGCDAAKVVGRPH